VDTDNANLQYGEQVADEWVPPSGYDTPVIVGTWLERNSGDDRLWFYATGMTDMIQCLDNGSPFDANTMTYDSVPDTWPLIMQDAQGLCVWGYGMDFGPDVTASKSYFDRIVLAVS
jgi:hypothetical protein